jgi:hypothetical protein
MNKNNIIPHCLIGIWPLLGFKRGMDSYDYHHSKNNLYNKQQGPPLFINKIGWGIGSACAYMSPFTFFIVLYKEVYRLEINIRGLEEEKKKDYYNEVI